MPKKQPADIPESPAVGQTSPAALKDANNSGIGRRRIAAKDDSSAAYQLRRQQIAEAAVAVFNRLGFQRASVSAIAAEMGIDRATFYYYFSSKEEMFDEIVRTVVERNAEIAIGIERAETSPHRKLRDLITYFMKSYEGTYPLLYIYIRENLNHVSDQRSAWSAHMRRLNTQITDSIVRIIEQGYEDGSFWRVGQPRIVAFAVLGMLNWSHRWYRPDSSPFSADEIGEVLANLAVMGLASPYERAR